ncbi:MAG: type II toxin-antitoxin system VapC family toxin [Steroidobacteraceae bacterium]
MVIAALVDSGPTNAAQDDLMQLDIDLFPFEPFAGRAWELHQNVTSYDAWCVALAEALKVPLATLDERGVARKVVGPVTRSRYTDYPFLA